MDKLVTLIEDIFEAEDALAPDIAVSELPTEFFSPLTTDSARPMLHPNAIRKLTSFVAKVTRPMKRLRLSSRDKNGMPNTPKTGGRVSQLDVAVLSRILRMLDRSVKAGEDTDPFRSAGLPDGSIPSGSPVKGRKNSGVKQAKHNGHSQTPRLPDDDIQMEHSSEPSEGAEVDHAQLTYMLDVARDSVLAADCCIAILTSDRLPKQVCPTRALFSNDLTSLVALFRRINYDLFLDY